MAPAACPPPAAGVTSAWSSIRGLGGNTAWVMPSKWTSTCPSRFDQISQTSPRARLHSPVRGTGPFSSHHRYHRLRNLPVFLNQRSSAEEEGDRGTRRGAADAERISRTPSLVVEEGEGGRGQVQATASEETPSSSLHLSPTFSYVLLNMVTILWGTQHAVIKSTLLTSLEAPGLINLLRFGLASLLFMPWTPSPFKEENRGIWKVGAELGFWMFLGYALQAVGLEFTSASKSGFLLYLNVKLVPLFAWILLGRRPTIDVWASAFVAFLGTALLSFDASLPNIGDLWSILAAAASAMFILRLEGAAKTYAARSSKELNSVTLLVTTGLCLVWVAVELGKGGLMGGTLGVGGGGGYEGPKAIIQHVVESSWAQVLYLGVVTTAICNWIQTIGQREVPAEKAALIYALDPVYGAVFARLLIGDSEALGLTGYIGASLVTGSAIFATIFGMKSTKASEGGVAFEGGRDDETEAGSEQDKDQEDVEGIELASIRSRDSVLREEE